MGGRNANEHCENNKNKNRRGTRGSGPRNGKRPNETGDKAGPLTMPESLEDYEGARKKLQHAVKAVVKANSEKLAKKIVEKAQGDVRGTQMMLSLIDKKKPTKEAKKKKWEGPSLQELLVSEPEWDEEDEKMAASGPET